jgi:CRP/FNR family transcriptional regulator
VNVSIKVLKRSPLFLGLNEKEWKEILAIASLKQVERGKILFSDCEEANGFYVVLSGKVKLYKISPEGKEQIVHVISAFDAFGEASLFLKGSHPFYAETLNDCQLLFFPKRDFLQLLNRSPRLSANLSITLSDYVKRLSSLVEDLSLREIPSRIAKYLLDLSLKQSKGRKSFENIELDLSRSQLASRLGTIRETLSKSLGKMKAQGIIDIKKSRISILNREALEKIAVGHKI